MKSHAQMLQSFRRRLAFLLMFRGAVRWTALWFFVWGVVVLAARISHAARQEWLLAGSLGFIPLAALAALREHRRSVAFSKVRAAYDRFNRCGGVLMAEETADMTAWHAMLAAPCRPRLRWRGGRSLVLLTVAAGFVLLTLYLPDRFTALASQRPLEIGKLVGELRAEVEELKQEKVLEEPKADDLQKQLANLQKRSSAADPNKTWEALDHMKESNSDFARRAAEEALSKTTSLTEAETLAAALQLAAESGLGRDEATRAARDLAGMMKAAKLEEGLLKADIPEGLLAPANGLSREDLEKLLSAIQSGKSGLGKAVTNLAKLKLIDPKLLSECKNAGQCPNPNALAAFLCQNTNQCNLAQVTMSYCRGGIDRGRGDAPMTWKEESSAEGAKFREEALPPSNRPSDPQLAGISRAAPELSGEQVVAEHGALAGARAGGGSANAQVVLPRHRQAVQNFFKRDE